MSIGQKTRAWRRAAAAAWRIMLPAVLLMALWPAQPAEGALLRPAKAFAAGTEGALRPAKAFTAGAEGALLSAKASVDGVDSAPYGGAPAEIETGFVQQSSDVAMDVTYGLNGAVKGGRYVPVRVALENQKESAFEGTIKILSQESDFTIYRYEYPVAIGAGEKKQVSIHIPLGSRSDQLYVTLTDQEGSVLVRKRLKMNISMDVAELFIGVLSDTPEQLQYLNGIGVSYSMLKTRTFSMTAEDIPTDDAGLNLLDVLLITNYDASRLSVQQAGAVMEWVKKGGTLLIGTGARASETLGRFQEGLVDEPYGAAVMREVDMGVEYAKNGPGESFIDLPCTEVSLRNGAEVLSNDQLSVLTSVPVEKGLFAVAAYDFVDIAQFCQVQRSYVDKLFVNLLGEDRINLLSSAIYGGNSSEYWNVQSLINTGDVDKLPSLPLYTAVVLLYILLVGPGLYLFLKHQERRRFYRTGIVMLSLLFSGIIYLMGAKTRFQSTFFTYATIEDFSENTITETTYLNMRTPYNQPYSVALDPSYDIHPVTQSYFYDTAPVTKFTGEEDYQVALGFEEDQTTVSVQNVVAFTPKYFGLQKKTENPDHQGLTGEITLFDGQVTGTVTNAMEIPLENAAVIVYGQMVYLGELQPGETKELDGLPVLNYPLNNPYMVADRISGGYQYKEADIKDKDYVKALARTNILDFYLGTYTSSFTPDARIIAFSRDQADSKFLLEGGYETYGMTMLSSTVRINTHQDGRTYRSVLMKRPTVVSGQYYPGANTAYGVDPIVLEYSLGNDLAVEKLTFNQLSDEFLDQVKYGSMTQFMGNMYFYNHDTGGYDQVSKGQTVFTGEELEPYLSPGNTITVKYVAEDAGGYNWYMAMPMPAIVGRDK